MALLNPALPRRRTNSDVARVALHHASATNVCSDQATAQSAGLDTAPHHRPVTDRERVRYYLAIHDEGDLIAPYVLADLGLDGDTTSE